MIAELHGLGSNVEKISRASGTEIFESASSKPPLRVRSRADMRDPSISSRARHNEVLIHFSFNEGRSVPTPTNITSSEPEYVRTVAAQAAWIISIGERPHRWQQALIRANSI